MTTQPDVDVAIVGAGFSGIGAAIALDRAGIENFVLLEEGDGVGGAWHWNTYPGIAVDIPSFSYQFSFEKRSNWSRVYAPGRELKAYAEHYGTYTVAELVPEARQLLAQAEAQVREQMQRNVFLVQKHP